MTNRHKIMTLPLVVVLAGFIGCEQKEGQRPPASLEKITIAVSAQPMSAPVYVAEAKGYLAQEGLQAALSSHTSGKAALAAVIDGQADFCTVAETPVMFAGLKGEKIQVVATVADSHAYMKIVAPKDRAIANPGDLRGKRVGVPFGTNAEYFLHAFLTFNEIAGETIHLVDVKPEAMQGAITNGDVDAIAVWNPYAAEVQKALGPDAVTLSNEQIYTALWNLVARQDFVATHPETVRKFLRALVRAERHIAEDPGAVRALLVEKTGTEAFSLDDYHYDLRLGQILLIALEDQARWAIRKGRADAGGVPNFLPLIYAGGMEAVAPGAVTLIHE